MTEDGGQRTDDVEERGEGRGQRAGREMTDRGRWMADGRMA
jgi:hypothetical protein